MPSAEETQAPEEMTLSESIVPPMQETALEWFGEHGRVAPTLARPPLAGEEKHETIRLLDPAKF